MQSAHDGTGRKDGSLMNATLGNSSTAQMRASDADRDAVLSELSEHFQAGRLTSEEFDDRAGRALAARTWGELTDLLRDLPSTLRGPRIPVAPASSAAQPERPVRHGAPAPVAGLVAIGIAIAVAAGITHGHWNFLWIVFALFLLRVIRHAHAHAHAPGSYGPRN
jgi:Domain of unknown function (DUF1707)